MFFFIAIINGVALAPTGYIFTYSKGSTLVAERCCSYGGRDLPLVKNGAAPTEEGIFTYSKGSMLVAERCCSYGGRDLPLLKNGAAPTEDSIFTYNKGSTLFKERCCSYYRWYIYL